MEETVKHLELTDELITGIETINEQHKALLNWANAVADDEVAADQDKLKEALNNLDAYTGKGSAKA